MNKRKSLAASQAQTTQTITANKVVRNSYALLSMTLLFGAITAGASLTFNLPDLGFIITLAGYLGLLFLSNND